MAAERNVVDFKIHNLTEEQFQELKAQGKIDPNAVYCTPDESLKRNQITNCITEIPQDIKLELSGGTLTLKAGSKVYKPNGSGVFDVITISSDKTLTNTTDGTYVVCVTSGGGMVQRDISRCVSGATRPLTTTYMLWYDTTNNVINNYGSDSSTPVQTVSLPIAIITVSDGAISSIDQVFNGFGYIGSTVFVLPGVKGLIPNGRNEDGSLKNFEVTLDRVKTTNNIGSSRDWVILDINKTFNRVPSVSYVFHKDENLFRLKTGEIRQIVICGRTTGDITSLEPKNAFHAVDYNDFESLSDTVETNNDNAVHKTGNETIDGVKTFNNTIRTKGSAVTFEGISTSSAQSFRDFDAYDDTSKAVGTIRIERSATNGQSVSLISRKSDGSVGASLVVRTNPAGTNSLFTSVTPPSNANGGEVATAAWVNAKFLPLAGGTMSGVITRSGTQLAKRNVDNSYLELIGGTTYLNGAYLRLDGKDSGNAGQFRLATGDGSTNKQLIGKPDGSLLWDNESVATTKAKSLAQNGYVKFNNGLIIQWGELAVDTSGRYTVNFPTAFTSTNYTITAIGVSTGKITTYAYVQYGDKTTTYVQLATTADAVNNGVRWLAIGY